ncbi:hypothetical protein [Blastococcus sp. SYSU D00813]
MTRALAWLTAAVVAATGVLLLRAELMTVHVTHPDGSYTEVLVQAHVVREDPADREEMTRSLVTTCRLLVDAEMVPASFRTVEAGVFRFRLSPGLDEFRVRELRGCLSDLTVPHMRAEVLHLETVTPAEAGGAPGRR